jgi:hypothetical protein
VAVELGKTTIRPGYTDPAKYAFQDLTIALSPLRDPTAEVWVTLPNLKSKPND